MAYLSVIAASYLVWFYPGFFSRPLLVIPLLVLVAIFCLYLEVDAFPVLIIALLFWVTLHSISISSLNLGRDSDRIGSLRGYVIQDSQQKSGRRTGYRILVDSVIDSEGNVFQGRGNIYVLSPQSDFYYGDFIEISGYFSSSVFYASEARLVHRPVFSSLRAHAISFMKNRFRVLEDAGELSSLLVLGTGWDGSFALASDARRSGLSHVLALSGMHLSIIASVLSPFLSFVFGRKRGNWILSICLFLFSFLSGWRPSLMRAFIFRMTVKMAGQKMAFILSFLLLLIIFPESSLDLGAIYSFLSLGGIFLLSEELEKALRFILPLPYALSLSISSSVSALVFSIPLTISVFGSYQLGAVITSFPFNALISLYMILSLLAVFLPFLKDVLKIFFFILEKGFCLTGKFPESTTLFPYILMLFIVFLFLVVKKYAVAKK